MKRKKTSDSGSSERVELSDAILYCRKRAASFLASPVTVNLPLFLIMLLFQLPQCYTNIAILQISRNGVGVAASAIGLAYILTLPASFFNNRIWKTCYYCVAIIFFGFFSLLTYICAVKFLSPVSLLIYRLLIATDRHEVHEFLQAYLNLRLIYNLTAGTVAGIILYRTALYVRWRLSTFRLYTITASSICIVCIIASSIYGILISNGVAVPIMVLAKGREVFHHYDLKRDMAPFEVEITSSDQPNIIIIMGESLDKSHCSIYGYEKQTTPLLSECMNKGGLILFEDITSPDTYTLGSFQQMLSLSDHKDDPQWQRTPLLPAAMNKGGYQTYWLSAQPRNDLYDNVMGEFAGLCSTEFFVSDHYPNGRGGYDGLLLDPFRKYYYERKDKPGFYFIHLIGEHQFYRSRYPKEFAYFKPKDYQSKPPQQRETLSYYDNAVRYTDYVVDKLLRIADNSEAIIIFTSDHGEDLFYTNPNSAHHGFSHIPNSEESSTRIPFIIYLTKPYLRKHPKIAEEMRRFHSSPFNTRYLMNTILEIAQIRIKGHDTDTKSLFKGTLSFDETP